MDGERWVGGVGQWGRKRDPVDGERRPFESVRYGQVVEERRVLPPHGVVLVHLVIATSLFLLWLLFLRHGLSLCGALALFSGFPAKKLGVEGMTGCGVGKSLYGCVVIWTFVPKCQWVDRGLWFGLEVFLLLNFKKGN